MIDRSSAAVLVRPALLLLGAVLIRFGQGPDHWPFVIIAGLALLIRFNRDTPALVALVAITIAYTAAWDIAYAPTMPVPLPWRLLISGSVGLMVALFFALDRMVSRRAPAWFADLVFPAGLASLDYLMGAFSPGGSGGSIAYSFAGEPVVAQLASVTGWTGLTFVAALIAVWLNRIWEGRGSRRHAAAPCLAITVLSAAIVIFGIARLNTPVPSDTVRIAAIVGPNTYEEAGERRADVMAYLRAEAQSEADRTTAREFIRAAIDTNLALIETALVSGARLALLPEANPVVRPEELDYALERASSLARRHSAYVGLAPYLFVDAADGRDLNQFILFGPDGERVWQYLKSKRVPGSDHAVGPGVIPVHESTFARLGAAICFDLDFPTLMQQAGRSDIAIMLVPSNDWSGIAELHARMARLRAIEQGFTLVRPTEGGVSLITDPRGRTISLVRAGDPGEPVILADIPSSAVPTLYGRIGDVFAWACVAILLVGFVLAVRPSRRQSSHA